MLNKEEFKKENLLSALKALDCSRNCPCCKYFDNNTQKCQDPTPYAVDLLEEFIQEHFELVEKYEMLDNTYSMICEDYLNPQPYKFEDLKAGMWVWCEKYDRCVQIVKTRIYEYDTGCFYGTIDEFREQVNKTRDGKIAKEYLMIADLMEYHFQKRGRSGR